jgi:hypothetical protein
MDAVNTFSAENLVFRYSIGLDSHDVVGICHL